MTSHKTNAMMPVPVVLTARQAVDLLQNPDHSKKFLIVDMGDEVAYHAAHIPGAAYLSYSAIVRHEPPVMGLLADADSLSDVLSGMGFDGSQHVIAYDNEGGGKAGRLYFTLQAIGHDQCSVIDGGLAAWIDAGGETESGPVHIDQSEFSAVIKGDNIADMDYILSRLDEPQTAIVDTRSPREFAGTDVRAARGGHIPGAVNMEWTDVMNPAQHRTLKSENQIRAMLESKGITADKEIIVYCQTHHRSAHTYTLLKHLGYPKVRGYPGAWSEWGNHNDTPVEN